MKKSALRLAIAAAALSSAGVMAATDGSLGTTSTGSVLVQISKGSVVQITGLADLIMGNYTNATFPALGVTAADDACVYSSTGNFTVQISGSNAGLDTYQAPQAPTEEILAAAAVPIGGYGFAQPGDSDPLDPNSQFNEDINADGVCDNLTETCVQNNGSTILPAIGYVAAFAGSGGQPEIYRLADVSNTIFIPYKPFFTSGASTLESVGAPMGPYPGSATVNCGGTNNVTIDARVSAADFTAGAVVDGVYSDTLTLLVRPD